MVEEANRKRKEKPVKSAKPEKPGHIKVVK